MFARPTSLRSALLLAVLVTVIPVLALNLYHAAGVHRQLRAARHAEAARLAEQTAGSVGRYLEGARQLLVALAHDDPIRRLERGEASARLAELRTTSPLFGNLLLIGRDGETLASAVPMPTPINVADRSYFRRLQANRRLGLGEYQVGRITGHPVFNLAGPLPGQPADGPLACVAASLDLGVLQRLLAELPRPADMDLVLLDRNGVVLAGAGVFVVANGQPFPGWRGPPAAPVAVADSAGGSRAFRFLLVPTADEGLWVGVGQLESAVTAAARDAFLLSLAATSLVAVAAFVMTWWIAGRLVLGPTRRLTVAAAALASGEWAARARLDRGAAELCTLGTTFDAMADHLHSQLRQLPADTTELAATRQQLQQAIAAQHAADAALRHSEATARAFIDSIAETALLLAPDGTILAANQTAAERLRRPLPELVGSNIGTAMSPELFASRAIHVKEVLATRRRVAFDDQRRDRMLHTELTPVLDLAGEVAAIAVLSFDITDRHLMEEKLRRSVAELEKALSQVRTLSGLLPICASCKRIRDDKGYWSHVEHYLSEHTGAEFSHGLCPECMHRLYPEYAEESPAPPPKPSAA